MLNSTVTVQFTIGFLDDNDNCIGDASAYSPVFLQYRQHENDQWITQWNTSDTTSNSILINNFCLLSLSMLVSLSTLVLNSMDRHEKNGD